MFRIRPHPKQLQGTESERIGALSELHICNHTFNRNSAIFPAYLISQINWVSTILLLYFPILQKVKEVCDGKQVGTASRGKIPLDQFLI